MDVVRLGILGGTFDPIHRGHIAIAQASYKALLLDKVLFVPAGDPPHKQDQHVTPAHHRVAMVDLAIKMAPYFVLSRVDVDRPGPHYATDMLARIQNRYGVTPKTTFFIIGTDSLIDLPTWHNPALLLTQCQLAVIHRPGYQPDLSELSKHLPEIEACVCWVEMPATAISSTKLRQKLADQGQLTPNALTKVLPVSVLAYIAEHNLYK